MLRSSFLLLLAVAATAPAQVRISQIYGGGGNTGAVITNDFVELYNPGPAAVDLTGWSVQYASSTGVNWSVSNLSGSIPAGGYFLVQQAAGNAGAVGLPLPNSTGSLTMSATAGKVALVNNTTALSGGVSGAGNNSCPTVNASAIVDFVGYGSGTTCYRGSGGLLVATGGAPAPGPSNTTAISRNQSGCVLGDVNATDFSATANITPRNTTSSGPACSGSSALPTGGGARVTPTAGNAQTFTAFLAEGANPLSTGLTLTCDFVSIGGPASVAFAQDGTSNRYTANFNVPAFVLTGDYNLPCSGADAQARNLSFQIRATVSGTVQTRRIFEITGSGNASPLAGQSVTTRGVVTAIRSNNTSVRGFYIESLPADRDSDPNTSEGLLVFSGSTPLPACAVIGNLIQIDGNVLDFVPSSAPPGSLPLTELASPSNCQVLNTGQLANLPSPVTLTTTNVVAGGAAAQLRKFLAMRVQIPSSVVVGPSLGSGVEAQATESPNGQFFVSLPGVPRPFRAPGMLATRRFSDAAPTVPSWNGNPEVLRIDTRGLVGGTAYEVTTGATITNLAGVVDYTTAQGQFQIFTDTAGAGSPSPASPTLAATPVPAPLPSDLTIGSFNMERFYNDTNESNGAVVLTTAAYQGRLNKASLAIRNVMRTPDILGLQEVESPRNGVGLQAYLVIQDLANKINADAVAAGQPNPNYGWCMGLTNDPGAIGVAFLYKQGKVNVQGCTQFGLATQYTEPGNDLAILNDRPPQVLHANVSAPNSDAPLPLRVIVNHLRSLNGIDQPGSSNGDRVRTKRNEQAIYLARLISGQLGEQNDNWNATGNLVLVGDFNAFQFNDGFVDVMGCIAGQPSPANEQYFTAAQLLVTSPCPVIPTPALTNLTNTNPAALYSFSFSGSAQTIDHILANASILPRLRQIAVGRNNADFSEGPTYRNDFNRSERVTDHDLPVAYFRLPVGVTNRTALVASGLILNRATGRYNGTIAVRNTGAVNLTGPVYVFFDNLPAGVTLPGLPTFGGVPYATISLTAPLGPGQTSRPVAISFANSSSTTRISYTTRRFDGSF